MNRINIAPNPSVVKFFCNNLSCIQLPKVIKVEDMFKSLVSWLAAVLEESYRNFEKIFHLQLFTTSDLDLF